MKGKAVEGSMAENSTTAWPGPVEIEVATPQNGNLLWKPTARVLRGRFDKANIPYSQLPEHFAQWPVLPGLYIRIDARRRTAEIVDPMSLPEHAELLKRFNFLQKGQSAFRVESGPEEPQRFEGMTDTQLKTWLYNARRAVDASFAVVRSGNLPTLEEIARLPGKTAMAQFETAIRGKARFYEDAED
jgi:hypothetical protein